MEQASTSSSEDDKCKSVLSSTSVVPENDQEKTKGNEDKAEASPVDLVGDNNKSVYYTSTSTPKNNQQKK
eukprot:7017342-Ditylum_brightwellii.AAC.1